MGILKILFKNDPTPPKSEPVLAAAISNTVLSEMYQDLLKENDIPYICRQNGADGYLKHITGGFLTTDLIYVKEEYYATAHEIYNNYIAGKFENEISDCEE